ncbi:MAG: class I SAM-dependent methyltransferase [Candidatus Velthaea sp.]
MEAIRARGAEPARVLEPACGSGAFLQAAAAAFPTAEIIGIEYQRDRFAAQLEALQRQQPQLSLRYANAYEIDFGALAWRARGPLAVVGNPPWVTAAALGCGPGDVLQPPRSNVKQLRGLAARTGAANFDVAEFFVLKVLRELRAQPLHLALLVKESVARKVLATAASSDLGIASAEVVRIDARRWFGVAVDACCLLLSTVRGAAFAGPVAIRPGFGRDSVGWIVPAPIRPPPPVMFRQGIKHDAADVFELRLVDGVWRNGYGEAVDVEPAHVYPLLKARALHAGTLDEPTALVVPQTKLGAATGELEAHAPRLWRYLCVHATRIAARKSSIYRNAPPFAIFGVGPYSFAPWKVAVAGFYAQPRFRVVGPREGRPVVLGDTSYFAAFEREDDARAFAALCTSSAAAAAIARRAIRGKRPITKALLDDLDWPAIGAACAGAPV